MSQQYGYASGRPNPFDQRNVGAAPQYNNQPQYSQASPQQYNQSQYSQNSPQYGRGTAPAMGRDDYGGQNVEMASLTQNGSQFGRQGDPNAILNECREIDNGINQIEDYLKSAEYLRLRDQALRGTDPTTATTLLAAEGGKIVKLYTDLTFKLKTIKQKPESGSQRNALQVGKVDRGLKRAIQSYREKEQELTNELRDQAARQYRLVHPNAPQAEVNEFVDDPGRDQQVFANAMMRTGRSGQATSVKDAVKQRSDAIQNIAEQMAELATLFNEMDNLVVQQEAAVVNIEQKGEEVVENLDKGTEQIGVAIKSARNRNKLKWWCLGITILIIIIVVVVVVVIHFVNQTTVKTTTKRFIIPDFISSRRVAFTPRTGEKIVVPGVAWSPGSEVTSAAGKMRRFQA